MTNDSQRRTTLKKLRVALRNRYMIGEFHYFAISGIFNRQVKVTMGKHLVELYEN
jgi:hypothetical protein